MANLRKLDYGVPTDTTGNSVQLGIDKGIFAEEGLDLTIRPIFGGPEIAAAYDSGELLIGEIGSFPAINAIAAGKQFRIVGSGLRQQAQMYLCVTKGIGSYGELRGKKLGHLGFGSCPDWISRKILTNEGVDPKDVEFVPLLDRQPEVLDMMADGRLDASLIAEPTASEGEARGVLDIWADGSDEAYLPNFQWIVRVANTGFIEEEPETVAALLRGCQRSAHYAAEHVEEWIELLVRHYRNDEGAARRSIDRELATYELDGRLDMAGLQRAVDMQLELGGIDEGGRAEDFVDSRFQAGLAAAA